MFRPMRKSKQALSDAETIEMLRSCTSGVLAVVGDEGYPYAVPLSYAYKDGKLFFHAAIEGHKLDSIKRNDKVSFCVIKTDDVIQKTFTTHYRSVIAFGRARILSEDGEKRYALKCLVEKYSPDFIQEGDTQIEKSWERFLAVEVKIEHMSGKAAKELTKN